LLSWYSQARKRSEAFARLVGVADNGIEWLKTMFAQQKHRNVGNEMIFVLLLVEYVS
jgi:hypothetical protein